MSLLENRLGDQQFLSIIGPVEPPRQILELDERPGVDGTEVTKTGIKGRPFQLVSRVDAANYSDAWNIYAAYLAMIDEEPVELVQGGISASAGGFLVKVLNVSPRIRGIVGMMGGLNPPSAALVEAVWDLVALPNEED